MYNVVEKVLGIISFTLGVVLVFSCIVIQDEFTIFLFIILGCVLFFIGLFLVEY